MSSIKKNLLALVFFSGLVQLAFAQDDTFLDDEIVAFAASNYLPSGKFNTPSWRNRPNPHLTASLADIYLNNDKLYLRGTGDNNHGLGWFWNFDGYTIDGPVLFGFDGGALGINRSGTQKMILKWKENGEVLIDGKGATNRLQIGTGLSTLSLGEVASNGSSLNYGTSYMGFNAARDGTNWNFYSDGANNGGSIVYGNVGGDIYFSTAQSSGGTNQTLTDAQVYENVKMIVRGSGQVDIKSGDLRIGEWQISQQVTQPNSYFRVKHWNTTLNAMEDLLALNDDGILYAKHVKVTITNFPDYVFDPSYDLMPIGELATFIGDHHHLPNVPSAQEAEADGISLGDMDKILLEKVEELTLYLIQQQEDINELKQQNEELRSQLKSQANEHE